ncbi:MAG: tRNA (adenosine(37)-N6)-dimethylallyltransferase MiaA [Salinarimonas sp.]|nr:tRNA (adenosine(37)-N6)-dimethylallyltransferase MiaA [Salinarimonas sp.]
MAALSTHDPVAPILIAGPTASGKSALALTLARALDGVVINADSMQVYADLRILTARPSPEEEAQAPHRLYGSVDGAENYSVGRWLADAGLVLKELRAAGRLPIFVGGTGLYFKALIEGLSAIPPVPEALRARLRAECADHEAPTLHARLAARDDAAAAQIQPNDRQRIMRALEVLEATGRSIRDFHDAREPGPLTGAPVTRLFLAPERDILRDRIDSRFDAMIEAGALDEVARLAARDLDPALPVMRAHGVPGLVAHLRGEVPLADAIMRGKADTRAYAKRQFTWFRNVLPGWSWQEPRAALVQARADPRGFLRGIVAINHPVPIPGA